MTTVTAPRVVAGTAVTAFLLCASRWGSHIGVSWLHVSDVMLIGAIVHFCMREVYGRNRQKPELGSAWLIIPIMAWAAGRLIVSGGFALDNIRDAAPYTLYLAGGLLAAVTVWDQRARTRTFWILFIALGVHALWVFCSVVLKAGTITIPLSDVPVFAIRPDFDFALCGVFAILLIMRIGYVAEYRWLALVGVAMCIVAILNSSTRAGLLGALAASGLGVVAVLASQSIAPNLKVATVTAIPMGMAFAIPILEMSTAGQRLVQLILTGDDSGTADARSRAWAVLLDWIHADPWREIFGTGFSVNILESSGADIYLLGASVEGVRAPHNFWYNTYAQMGIVGLGLVLVPVLLVVLSLFQNRQELARQPFFLAIHAIPLCILPIASFGVVLESPFGAIPFWWAIGAALVWRDKTRRDAFAEEVENPWAFPSDLFRRKTPRGTPISDHNLPAYVEMVDTASANSGVVPEPVAAANNPG